MPRSRYLITGALGCIGAWTSRLLLEAGDEVVAFDVGGSDHRLRLVLSQEQHERLVRITGDVAAIDEIEDALDTHEITHVIHLAALQVPACAEDTPLGAVVNVVGTVNVFEAVKRRLPAIDRVVYASSAAVYGSDSHSGEDAQLEPETHYGVFKRANEGSAAVYWSSDGITSLGLRPYVVYGPGRDQGLTSAPTAAMLAAARREPFHIPWGGRTHLQYVADVARALIQAATSPYKGALVANVPGPSESMRDVVEAIRRVVGDEVGEAITYEEIPLPFPDELEANALEAAIGSLPRTMLEEGVRETIETFRRHETAGAPK